MRSSTNGVKKHSNQFKRKPTGMEVVRGDTVPQNYTPYFSGCSMGSNATCTSAVETSQLYMKHARTRSSTSNDFHWSQADHNILTVG